MKSLIKASSKKMKSAKEASAKRPARPAAAPKRTVQPVKAVKSLKRPAPIAPPPLLKRPVKTAAVPPNGQTVPPVAVLTNGKPRKNQAGLTTRELEMYRTLLLNKRGELLGDMSSMERDSLYSSGGTNLSNLPMHMADMGTDNYEQEFTLGLMEKDRKLLKEIYRALAKIQNGTYGICEGTGKPISKVRLEAQPWARYSIEYARKLEHVGVGRTQS
jgi:RNA polymerase-binding transcription factor